VGSIPGRPCQQIFNHGLHKNQQGTLCQGNNNLQWPQNFYGRTLEWMSDLFRLIRFTMYNHNCISWCWLCINIAWVYIAQYDDCYYLKLISNTSLTLIYTNNYFSFNFYLCISIFYTVIYWLFRTITNF